MVVIAVTETHPRRPLSIVTDFFGRLGKAIAVFGAAVRVANAIESRARPDPRDLALLDIEPDALSARR